MRTSVLFGAKKKLRIFSKFMVFPHGQGRMKSIFRDIVRTSCKDSP